MTLHYHGLPITPAAVLHELHGKCFCASFANRGQEDIAHAIGQSVMHDNGAYTVWKASGEAVADWNPYYSWVEPLIANAIHWAVIPDHIDGGQEVQDHLLQQWPFGDRGAPVWHLDEPIERLLQLADSWAKICFGSTAQYASVGSDLWLARVDLAFGELYKRFKFLPWIHMLRGMQCCKWGFPFSSVDSASVGRNHGSGFSLSDIEGGFFPVEFERPAAVARAMIEKYDARQCPDRFSPRPSPAPSLFLRA